MTANLYPGYNSGARPASAPATAAAAEPSRTPGARWVFGTPGGGLENAHWAANADVAAIGRKGELRTAEVLNALSCTDGAAVLHDLRIPIPGMSANIDHIVVSGTRVLIVDTKVWRPGFFWTIGQHTRRGVRAFPSADKQTMVMGAEAIERFLAGRHIDAKIVLPLVAVWPSSQHGRSHFWAMRFPGARVIRAETLARRVGKFVGKPANALLVATLAELLNNRPHRPEPPKVFTNF